ncbi:MAG: sensor histidine kinase N-terminal domain-containing protein [Rubrivivax sp.]|nr:sensor histidine kinase N-terminal domain-containing protein [Rubrivivax sp.]
MSLGLHSLRARLLSYLLAAIALVAAVQAAMAYRTALAEADAVFDHHMQQTALSLRAGLPVDADAWAADADGRHDEDQFEFVVQIWAPDGRQLFRSARGAALPRRAVLGFSDIAARDTTYRVYSLQSPAGVIQVAQDLEVRRTMARTLALRTVLPVAALAPLLMAAAWWVVGTTLLPLRRLREQLAQRRADDLSPVGEGTLPDEVRPLVHELNQLFARLRQAFDVQKTFVADAAHELRSPLAALKLQVQGLARAQDEGARQRAVTRLDAGVDRATHLVEQLLVLARQQEGRPERGGPALPAEVVALALADVAPAAQERQVELGLVRADAVPVSGDEDALRLLLRNLLDNAVKYTPAGGRVEVAVEREPGALCLRVEDSGPGIPEHERERVLDRFYRLPGSPGAGSGLGLSIVKAIADAHGGTLTLGPSERLGGLRAELRLPLERALSPP